MIFHFHPYLLEWSIWIYKYFSIGLKPPPRFKMLIMRCPWVRNWVIGGGWDVEKKTCWWWRSIHQIFCRVCWGGFKIQKRLCLFHLSFFVVVVRGTVFIWEVLVFLKKMNQKKVLQMPFSRGYLDPSLPKKSKTFGHMSNEKTLVGWVI